MAILTVWQDLEKHFATVTDRLDMPIDPGIMDVVVAFNAVGIHTTQSCEGHLDHGAAHPWVDVSSKEADDIAQKIAWKLYEGKREDDETQRLMQEHRQLLLQAEYELIPYLNAFYQHQPFDYDRHLSISRFSNGMPRVQSYGADCQEFRSGNERVAKLKAYQQEMQAFADFLKRRYFGEDGTEYPVGQAADLLGMRHRTLTSHIERGNVAATKKGRDYYISHDELERFKNRPRKVGRPAKV
jgi:hypothetical protein